MGVWSNSIYGNDISCDARDEYLFWLRKQCSNEEAYLRTVETFSELLQTDEKNYFWEALADTQWKVGRLSETVKQNAINEANNELSEGISKKRKEVLLKLIEKLNSPMPAEKQFEYPKFERNLWNVGDIYAYQFNRKISKNFSFYKKYVTFQKVGEIKYYDSYEREEWILPIIQVYDKIFDELPQLEDILGLNVVPFDRTDVYFEEQKTFVFPLVSSFVALRLDERDYNSKWFKFIGNTSAIRKVSFDEEGIQRALFFMGTWERNLCDFIDMWNDVPEDKRDIIYKIMYK